MQLLKFLWPKNIYIRAAILNTLGFILLQIWRPCYFLTDDTLTGGLGIIAEIGRHLGEGHSPFISDYLFGGNYNLLADPGLFNWHPFIFLVAYLSNFGLLIYSFDIVAFLNLQIAMLGFVAVSRFLKKKYSLSIHDNMILFYALSFNFNLYVLNVTASWNIFLNNHSAVPWLVLAILSPSLRTGISLVALFQIHQILGGHPLMTISTGLILSLFTVTYASQSQSIRPLLIWGLGSILSVVLISPLLVDMVAGYYASTRSSGLDPRSISGLAMPLAYFPVSLFAGGWTSLHIFNDPTAKHMDVLPVESYLGCAASWCIAPALLSFRRFSKFEQLLVFILATLVIFISRPFWISEVMSHLPLLNSFRWPFREIMQFEFFFHLFLVTRRPGFSRNFRMTMLRFGAIVFLAPLPYAPVPAINHSREDRDLVMSGQVYTYWAEVRKYLKPGEMIVPIIDRLLPTENQASHQVPFCLLGTANFAGLIQVKNATGYSPTAPIKKTPLECTPFWGYGAYTTEQVPYLIAKMHQKSLKLRLVVLEHMNPLRISLVDPIEGTAIDLTPLIPEKYRRHFTDAAYDDLEESAPSKPVSPTPGNK